MIILTNLSKTVTEKALFDSISLKISEGQKVGLVGPNGVGKTTLLNIIAGQEEPDAGSVQASNEKIGYLKQTLENEVNQEVGEYVRSFLAEAWEDYKVNEVLAQVGLQTVSPRTMIAKLSGGQKMKVGLAGLLLSEPTTLLLDEPTNNLDLESIIWLEHFIQDFTGKVLLVSHDRFFLDACVNKIVELNPFTHKIAEFGGNYTSYKQQKQVLDEHQAADYFQQQKKETHMREWIAEKQQQLKYHPSNKVARQLQAMKTRVNREIESNRIEKVKTYSGFKIDQLGNQLHQGKAVISLYDFAISQLLVIPELHFFGQERIQLLGKNGAGKTTLLKAIVGEATFYTGRVEIGPNLKLGYFSQEHELLDPRATAIDEYCRLSEIHDESKARQALGTFLFSKQKVFASIESLSEGEKARLLLAAIINQHNDFLLLDEPTNHLDLESREVLAQALRDYAGGFLVISHDRYFIQQIAITRQIKIDLYKP